MFVEEDSAVHLGRGGGHASPASAREWDGVVGPAVGKAVASSVRVSEVGIFLEDGVIVCRSEGPKVRLSGVCVTHVPELGIAGEIAESV